MPFDVHDLDHLAILLDVDGTLLDIAPTPREVVVPPDLTRTLKHLGQRLGGALALVSGRPIATLDEFFKPLRLPAIGGHGAEMRPLAKGRIIAGHGSALDSAFKAQLKLIAADHPGVLIEDKGYSLALHYRLAPKEGVALIHDVKHAYEAWGDKSIEMLTGKAVIELKFAGFNKGTAVRTLMGYPLFAGRAPVFVGDDRTDEDAFAVVPEFNGHSISVGRRLPGIDQCIESPAEVRRWLERLADGAVERLPRENCGGVMTGNGKTNGKTNGHGRIDHGLDLAVIGNGRTAALVEPTGRLVWWCYPRFDGDPVFCRLVSGDEEKGFSDVVLDGMVKAESEYVRNTAVVSTVLTDRNGGAVRITDFAPRFRNFGRVFRPPQLMRMVEPIAGLPRITIRMRPAHSYGEPIVQRSLGSNHIRYSGGDVVIRLTTDAPLSYIDREAPFVLNRTIGMILGADEPAPGEITTLCREFADRTRDYWTEWVRRLSISYDWQDPIIRAAITLKLSNFEETGGIVAALTTSIPEAPGSGRTWDYRYCWLRDAYFVVKALNRIGATQTMEDFISFILGIAANHTEALRPVYPVVPTDPMEEMTAAHLKGYRGDGPVRIGNAAALQDQNDTYGSIILAAMPMFFDHRLPRPGDESLFRLLETLGEKAATLALEPDAGIWEFRGRKQVHTHSAAMCWAGVNRLGAIAARLGFTDRAVYWNTTADKIQSELLEQSWNPQLKAFTAAVGTQDIDASVLLLPEIGLIEASDPRFVSTVAAVERELLREKNVMRYANSDDFGLPETAFLICRFWLIDAWWALGRKEEARELFNDALNHRNRYGLLSEDIHPQSGALWGNFPQTYSMAGLILTAMRLSRSWEDRYWRG